ncbi:MAG: cysteine desulfurase [Acidobacteria bacterium]|nr:cysteine desulfurase [Acidobacteriota bacterium]
MIYFDNNATTRIHPEVLAVIHRHLDETWGNPSSVHHPGRLARRAIEEAREEIAALIGASPGEIVFTSGGTESNNAAIFGRALQHDPKRFHIVTTSIEHPAVQSVVLSLEERGHPVTRVSPDRTGRVNPMRMIDAITETTGLVTMMLANNETGVIQPVAEVSEACRDRAVPLHTDAVQAIGKLPVDVEILGVDSLSLSGHKFHGPKGIGVLYVRKGTVLAPFVLGGTQERRRRGGTENVPIAAGLGKAAQLARESLHENIERTREQRDRLERQVLETIPRTSINGREAERLPNTSSISLEGCDSESLVIGLDLEGACVSAGSACSSGRVEPSTVLVEMGLTPEQAKSTIRVSLCGTTTAEEVDRFVGLLSRVAAASREAGAVSI